LLMKSWSFRIFWLSRGKEGSVSILVLMKTNRAYTELQAVLQLHYSIVIFLATTAKL
jgi:hypothetical protein